METESVVPNSWSWVVLIVGVGVILFLIAVRVTSRILVRPRLHELRETESRFQVITEHSADAIFIADQEGQCSYVNHAASELLGYSKEDLVGMSIFDLIPEDEVAQTREWFAIIQQHGPLHIEIELMKYDRSCIPVDLNTVVLPDGSVYSSCREISERRQTEETLQKSENRYRELFDSSPAPLWEQDFSKARQFISELRASGVGDLKQHFIAFPEDLKRCADLIAVTDVNQATVSLFRATSKDTLMESIQDVFTEESVPVFLKSILSIDAGETSFASNQVLQALDGQRLVVAFQWTQTPDRVLAFTRDITARIRAEDEKMAMEQQLRQSQKLESIGTLASGVAHEINNPLMGMMNYAELVKGRVQDPTAINYLEEINHEGKRIAKIVRNLLSFARQDNEEYDWADIKDIVDDSLSLIGSLLRKDQIAIVVDVPADLPKVKCRSQQIQQVMINLFTNAHDALNARYPEGHAEKIVRIAAHLFENDGEDWIRITFEDHGVGIPEDVAQRIFDPFFTTKSRHEGTGLGLSISFGIVREHRGGLTVESVPGEYTRFHIDLPVNNG